MLISRIKLKWNISHQIAYRSNFTDIKPYLYEFPFLYKLTKKVALEDIMLSETSQKV